MSGKELIKLMKKEGWVVERINGSHHIMTKEEKSISVPVHSNKDIPPGTLNKILKQAGLK